jgi:hypothetical protein
MERYTHIRKKKWFSMLGSGPAGTVVEAVYNGQDSNGRPDPIGEGIIGKTYNVIMLAKSDAILAPCPDFCNDGETIKLNTSDRTLVDRIRNGKPLKSVMRSKGRVKTNLGPAISNSIQIVPPVSPCQPYSESEFLIYMSFLLNRTKLPYPVRNYIYKEEGIYRLDDDLIGLIRELHDSKPISTTQLIAVHAYFALAFYYRYVVVSTLPNQSNLSKNLKKSCLENIAKVLPLKPQPIIKSFLIGIKNELTTLQRALVLVSYDYRQPNDFQISLQGIKKIDVKLIKTIKPADLKIYFSKYSHVLIFGHGDENATYLGDTKLSDNQLIKAIGTNNQTLSALGIFSCQENLPDMKVKNHIDYFITNSHTCSEKTAKGFASAYFSKLLQAQDILKAYDHAAHAMLFRIIAELGFQLYQGGVRIR